MYGQLSGYGEPTSISAAVIALDLPNGAIDYAPIYPEGRAPQSAEQAERQRLVTQRWQQQHAAAEARRKRTPMRTVSSSGTQYETITRASGGSVTRAVGYEQWAQRQKVKMLLLSGALWATTIYAGKYGYKRKGTQGLVYGVIPPMLLTLGAVALSNDAQGFAVLTAPGLSLAPFTLLQRETRR